MTTYLLRRSKPTSTESKDTLKHHGIKGQKWGVSRSRIGLGRENRNLKNPHYAKARTAGLSKIRAAIYTSQANVADEYSTASSASIKKADALSTELSATKGNVGHMRNMMAQRGLRRDAKLFKDISDELNTANPAYLKKHAERAAKKTALAKEAKKELSKAAKIRDANKKAKAVAKAKKKNPSMGLSDDQLRKRVTRLNMEKQYKNLLQEKTSANRSRGANFAIGLVSVAATTAIRGQIANAATKAVTTVGRVAMEVYRRNQAG